MSSEDLLGGPPNPSLIFHAKLADRWRQWDHLVSSAVTSGLKAVGFNDILTPSPVTAHRFFTRSPTPLVTVMAAYLTVVLLGLATQKQKKSRKEDPLLLRVVLQAHNLFLITLSAYMFGGSVYQAVKNQYSFWGTGYKDSEEGMANVIYVFYVSKIYEYMDTIMMLIKGNIRQVSFLHVYHHVSISFIWWSIALVAPGGDAWYSCALNSLVHVLMYTYYFLASLLGKDEKKRAKYLWWGKYITQFQMVQFMTMIAQAAFCYMFSPYPKFLSSLLFWYMLTLLALFINFYAKKYFTKAKIQ